MLFSERKENYYKKPDFETIKSSVAHIFSNYIVNNSVSYVDEDSSDWSKIDQYFVVKTKNLNLKPTNFRVGVKSYEDLFDMIEVGFSYLYKKYEQERFRYRFNIDVFEVGKYFKEINEIITQIGYCLAENGLILNLPMDGFDGLINDVSVNEDSLDKKIDYAIVNFFRRNATTEDKRNACKMLGDVAENLRKELEKTELKGDVKDLFQIINNFHIRHYKKMTKEIGEEGIEWLFYVFLTTFHYFQKVKTKN